MYKRQLFNFVLPGLLADESPTLVSLVGTSAIMFVVLYLAHGFSARTTTALVGTLSGLTLVAVLGSVAVSVARLTGLTSEETITLQGYDPTLNFSALVLAVPLTTVIGAFFATAAASEVGEATDRRMTALRTRFAR